MNGMKSKVIKIMFIILSVVLFSCSNEKPEQYVETNDDLQLYPDYRGVTVPCNVAPLNFMIKSGKQEYVVAVKSPTQKEWVYSADEDGKIFFPKDDWAEMLKEAIGDSLQIEVYEKGIKWKRYPQFYLHVVSDSIDKYITYRLIEPAYRPTGHVSLVQFHLETGEETTIVNNEKPLKETYFSGQTCLNCHSTQKNGSGNTMFFYRGKGGGLVVTYNGETKIVNTKLGDVPYGTVYPSWHPTQPMIAFSSTLIKQYFLTTGKRKIHPFNVKSDIVLYNIEKNELSYVVRDSTTIDTYPCWHPNGKTIYYASTDSVCNEKEASTAFKLKYDIKRIHYNEDSLSWGNIEMVFCASKLNKSATQPKLSPDGNYLLFAMMDNSSHSYTQDSSDLVLMDLRTNELLSVDNLNSDKPEGYHDWSTNGRWILVSTRRENGNHARVYISHFSEDGKISKPFALPHHDPERDLDRLQNYNMVEFSPTETKLTSSKFYSILDDIEVINAEYKGETNKGSVDAQTGASVIYR